MKKSYFILISFVIAVISISGFTFYVSPFHKTGMAFATGSPYDSGSTCAEFACHAGGSTVPSIAITANPAFGTGNTFIPGATYTVNIVCSGNYPKYGFNLEMLNALDTSARDQGVLDTFLVNSNCQMIVNADQPTNLTHKAPSGTGNMATFSFIWTPANDTAYLFCSEVGANANNMVSGDRVNTTSMVLTPYQNGIEILSLNDFNLRVFHNPSENTIAVSYLLEKQEEVSFRLIDMNGKNSIHLFNGIRTKGRQEELFKIPSTLSQAVYFLQIATSQGYFSKKIIL